MAWEIAKGIVIAAIIIVALRLLVTIINVTIAVIKVVKESKK